MAVNNQQNGAVTAENPSSCIKLESVDRISKFPVVESTLQMGKNMYDKVKDYNGVTNWTISTAENTVCKAVKVGKPYASPVVHSLGGPIKKVDDILCSGLDFVESKVPAVKLPPTEVYNTTKGYINSSTTVQTACSIVQPAVATAKGYMEPAVETAKSTVQGAKNMMEPAFENAKKKMGAVIEQAENMVEPYMSSSMEKAAAIKDYLKSNGQEKDGFQDDGSDEGKAPKIIVTPATPDRRDI